MQSQNRNRKKRKTGIQNRNENRHIFYGYKPWKNNLLYNYNDV